MNNDTVSIFAPINAEEVDVYALSEEFERDAKRYNRAFSEEQEVSAN